MVSRRDPHLNPMKRLTRFIFLYLAVFASVFGGAPMIFAASTMPTSKIMGFYDSTLAQLGWVGGNGDWIREKERLVIGEVETARGPLWRIKLQPN